MLVLPFQSSFFVFSFLLSLSSCWDLVSFLALARVFDSLSFAPLGRSGSHSDPRCPLRTVWPCLLPTRSAWRRNIAPGPSRVGQGGHSPHTPQKPISSSSSPTNLTSTSTYLAASSVVTSLRVRLSERQGSDLIPDHSLFPPALASAAASTAHRPPSRYHRCFCHPPTLRSGSFPRLILTLGRSGSHSDPRCPLRTVWPCLLPTRSAWRRNIAPGPSRVGQGGHSPHTPQKPISSSSSPTNLTSTSTYLAFVHASRTRPRGGSD
ncbi:hypothetical protein R3P38DRAFT_2940069, partial [Favolaschia claudopus]